MLCFFVFGPPELIVIRVFLSFPEHTGCVTRIRRAPSIHDAAASMALSVNVTDFTFVSGGEVMVSDNRRRSKDFVLYSQEGIESYVAHKPKP